MALSGLDSPYMAIVSDHSESPYHHEKLEDVDQINLNNPACGDVISLPVKFSGDHILDIALADDGCTISIASSNVVTDAVIGKTEEEALELVEILSEMVQGEKDGA